MVSNELKGIVAKLEENGKRKMLFWDGATEEQIAKFEKENAIRLPEQFRQWLEFSDGGDCCLPAGVQFYGVAHKPLIDVNCNDRPDDSYVVIGALSFGDPILFKKNSEEIAIYNQEAGRIEDDEKYDNFFSFLNDLLNVLGLEG